MATQLARLVCVSVLLASMVLPAAAQSPPGPAYSTTVPRTQPEPGRHEVDRERDRINTLTLSRPITWIPQAVALQAVRASVAIDEQVATTSFELTLYNPAPNPQEAQLLLPIPDGVTVRSFQYDGTGPEPTATILPRDEARRIYDSIVRRSRDPGLLEFAALNVIRTSVFPVPAQSKQTVRLTYEQVLSADAGRVDYYLPRSESLSSTGVSWQLSASVKSSRPIATVYSPSHEIALDRQGAGSVSVRLPERAADQPGAFRLSYITSAPAGAKPEIAATLLAYPDPSVGNGDGGYFLLLGGLPTLPPAANITKREVTLVLDRSGSMRGPKMDQAKAAAQQVLDGLNAGEFFNIIDFSDSIASFAPAPVEKTAESAKRARDYVSAIQANGGTALHDALMESLRQPPTPNTLPLVLFMTDGLPTVGERSEVRIRDAASTGNPHHRRVFTVGVGYDVNTPLLAGIAKLSRAASTLVRPEENVELAVSQVFRRLVGPVLASPRLIAVGEDGKPASNVREVLPGVLPDFFDGDQVVILGQYTGGKKLTLRLDGQFLGEPTSFDYTFDLASASARNGFVPRLWATRKIGMLIDEIRQGGANGGSQDPRTKELVDEIVRLSTRFGILTEYTSFLATERDGRTALGGAGGAPPPAAAAPRMADELLQRRGLDRTGAASANQEANLKSLAGRQVAASQNSYLNEKMEQVQINTVQMVGANALFQRGQRWVDARLLADADKEPQRTIAYGTPEYDRAIDAMAKEQMLWTLTNQGELYLMLEGQRTLLKAP